MELGYKENKSALIDIKNGYGGWVTKDDSSNLYIGHISYIEGHGYIRGNISDLLFTDKYKPAKQPIKVVLNKDYTAEVTDKEIKVGCQVFSVEKLKELRSAVDRYANG